MFEEYQLEVLRAYQQKKTEGLLLNSMLHPTPANLKKECTGVFDRRYLRKDEVTINSFFGPQGDEEAYRVAIRKFDRDKFRPLITVLKNGNRKTDRKNIELLAWLIDFEPRPYTSWLKKHDNRPADVLAEIPGAKLLPSEPHPENNATGEPQKDARLTTPVIPLKALRTLIVIFLMVFAGGAVYWLWLKPRIGHVQPKALAIVPEKCMYWAGDNYVSGPCNLLHGDTPVVALDTFKLIHFKKYTNWGSLTEIPVKKVWYAKVNGTVELYTSPGMHPVDTNRRLLPLTAYILKKYVVRNR